MALKYYWLTLCLFPLIFSCAGKSPDPVPPVQDPAVSHKSRPMIPDNLAPNHLALARTLMENKHYEVALVQLKSALKKKGADAAVYDMAGVCTRETGDYKAAQAYFEKALALEPENASVYNNLGLLYWAAENPEKAESNFTRAVDLDPGRPDYMNNLGYFYLDLKNYAKAETILEKALDLDPGYEPALNNLIICLGLQYKDSQALDLLMAQNDKETAWQNMAWIYTRRNEPEKAKALMETLGKSLGGSFDIQSKNGEAPGRHDPGMPGDISDLIYTKKFQPAMKSDAKGISSGSSN